MSEEPLVKAICAALLRRFGSSHGPNGWYAREFTDEWNGETFEAIAGPFASVGEADREAMRAWAHVILRIVREQ